GTGAVAFASVPRSTESARNVVPIAPGTSKPIYRMLGHSRSSFQAAEDSRSDLGPFRSRVPASIQSKTVRFHNEQSSKTAQNPAMIALTSYSSRRATGSQ